jgi:hypothetical protein
LGWKVTVEQYSIVELCYVLEDKGGQFLKCLADDKVVTSEFIRRKFSNYLLYLGSFESDERRFELERVSTSDVRVASGVELGSEG